MTTNWWTRFVLYMTAVVVAFVFTLPTLGWDTAVPSFLKSMMPDKAINLGLDLRGGMHLVLEVDTGKAIENNLEIQSRYFLDEAKKEKLPVEKVQKVVNKGSVLGDDYALRIILKANTSEDATLTKIKKLAGTYLGNMAFQRSDSDAGRPVMVYTYRDNAIENINQRTLDQSLDTIRNRVDAFGVSEPSIQRQGSNRIIVQLPGLSDPERAKRLIGKTAQLSFMLVDTGKNVTELTAMIVAAKQKLTIAEDDFTQKSLTRINAEILSQLPENTIIRYEKTVDELTNKVSKAIPYLLENKVYITGEMIEDAFVSQQRQNVFDRPRVVLHLNNKGGKIFARVTGDNVNRQLAIVLDDVVRSAPRIDERIAGGQAVIRMGGTNSAIILREAQDLSLVLKAGALPAPITILEERTVGPSLGQDSVLKGKNAVMWGMLAVLCFMLVYYRLQGVVADLSVSLNLLFIVAALSSLQATLTLPGIAGIALTIGMAVDCNILINERIREELLNGKTIRAAISSGFEESYSAIFDANITTFFTAFILLQYGSGPIKGFAVTLIIGIAATLFSSYFGTKIFMELLGEIRSSKTVKAS